ncbi:hypothetical protein [Ochrobactrum sp. EDr1-4]|uniref:hypothetical protein n=1 Tax=Ochrobactrum sp. EDr1-4 TaxID=3368622 RepID=UPI003BA00333
MIKTTLFAAAIIFGGTAFSYAENPYTGFPASEVLQYKAFRMNGPNFLLKSFKHDASHAKVRKKPSMMLTYRDGSAHRFGDASPSSYTDFGR